LAKDNIEETFRVIDRRLFNEAGELREEALEEERAEKQASPPRPAEPASTRQPERGSAQATAGGLVRSGGQNAAPAAAATPAKEAPAPQATAGEPARPSRAFQMLIDLLYSNAAVYLGGYADPATGRAILDLEGARNIIDMMEALREKTRGRLTPEEDTMVVEVLGSLKMAFLEVSKAASKAMKENPAVNPQKLRSKS